MNLLVRMLWMLLTVPFRSRLAPLDTSVRKFIVWPNDLDLNLHMNNGRFLTVMDLGRFDLSFRTGLGGLFLKGHWRPVLGAAKIRYRRSLAPFQRYELHTRMLAWDDKWLYLEQRFMVRGELYAEALVKTVIKGPEGTVSPRDISVRLGLPPESPNPVPQVN